MDLLRRELAPVLPEAWEQIDEEARRVLKLHLAARKIVDFSGPHGWNLGCINTGRLKPIQPGPIPNVAHSLRDTQPLVEVRAAFTLPLMELDFAARGANDLDLDPVIAACERIALAEDGAVFNGFKEAHIRGIIEASPHAPIPVGSAVEWPQAVAKAKEVLRRAGMNGPYSLALGPKGYDEVTAASEEGYPLRKRIELELSGPVVWAPALRDGALLLTARGGDFELTVGQDLSVGYYAHDRENVDLFITESFTFRVLEDKAAILLKRA
ncbi:MAG TPA: family 1 encapsulin nanocompartment shell protein [Polyangiaceae bacterium]|jgi:uncharacterized linocin/CFP29 family protein|nr:family 1 encapsulin nanocompartment shell protein [Polyangiaceae bacterium]